VIQSLVAEVKQITQSMLLQLLQRLRSSIQVKGIVLYQEARTYGIFFLLSFVRIFLYLAARMSPGDWLFAALGCVY
jgi:hypothetical protein